MKFLVFGSLNLDRTYTVDHFVGAGETLSARKMEVFCGGKGFNQAVAMARAGSEVYFAGAVGADGEMMVRMLQEESVHTDYVKFTEGATGHAIIQVNSTGQNCIMILAGANGSITRGDIDCVLENFHSGDLIVLQNEISNTDYALRRAKERGMIVAFNPSPYDERAAGCDLSCVDYLFVNETEGTAITGASRRMDVLLHIHKIYPGINTVLTLGKHGACYMDSNGEMYQCGIYDLNRVNATAAGDTFTGYFLSEIFHGRHVDMALQNATIASGISVSREGSSASIPYIQEILSADRTLLGFRCTESDMVAGPVEN